MRRIVIPVISVLAIAAMLAGKEQSIQELIARANSAPVKEQPALFVEVAERELKVADELYTTGKVDEARQAVGDIVTYSQKAHDSAIESGKKLKNVELAARKMSHKLVDMKRTLNFEDQAPVQSAADRLQALADDLLSRMFGKEK